ncbi:MAG: hypothetical protein ACYCOX_12290 [Acidobacteriaceae bacterium]
MAIAQTSVPSSGQTPNNNGNEGHPNHNETATGQTQAKPIPPVVPKSTSSSYPETETGNKPGADTQNSVTIIESAAMPNKRDWVDYTTLGLGIAIALITGFGVAAAWCGLPEFKRQAEAAQDAANAALKQASHIVTSERAWIIANVDTVSSTVEADVRSRIFPKIRNVGKTPAFLLEKSESSQTLDRGISLPDEPIYPAPEQFEGNGVPLAPNGELPIFLRGFEFDITPSNMLLYDKMVLVWGYVKYRDAFGSERETRYCYSYEISSTWKMIALYLVGPTAYNRTT